MPNTLETDTQTVVKSKSEIWAWARNLKTGRGADKAVLLALVQFSNKLGVCHPSHATIAANLDVSTKTVERALERLRESGAIERELRHGKGGRRISNWYQINAGSSPRFEAKPNRQFVGRSNRQIVCNSGACPTDNLSATNRQFGGEHFVEPFTEPIEDIGLVDRPVSSNNTEQAASLPAAAPRIEGVGKEESGTYSRLVKRTGVNPDTAEVNRDVFSPGIASSALAQLSARIDAGEAIRNPTLIFTRICEDLRREAARGVKPLTEDEKLEIYFRAQAKREGRQYMGRG